MHSFHGDLLIGGLAIKNLDGEIDGDETSSQQAAWEGQFKVDPCQTEVLELGRQYLLILDDGRNREVMLTEIDEQADDAVVCRFEACGVPRHPK